MPKIEVIIFLVLVVAFWSIVSFLFGLFGKSKNREDLTKDNEGDWNHKTVDKSKSLEERNKGIIQKHIRKLNANSYQNRYYIENSIRDCIQEITESEGDSEMSPNYEWLSQWETRANPEYLELKDSLLERFNKHYKDVQKKTEEKQKKELDDKYNKLKSEYENIISQFIEITYRKVSTIDDYGDENWNTLPKEIYRVIQKIAQKEGYNEEDYKDWSKYEWSMPEEFRKLSKYLENRFKKEYETKKKLPISNTNFTSMLGVDFENHLARLLRENGFTDVSGTPATGDQGADLIAKRNNKTIIVQAKRYDGTVGNKAVQEVASAVKFYGADEGWVITNSLFTKSAKILANKLGIRLIDGVDLRSFSDYIKSIV